MFESILCPLFSTFLLNDLIYLLIHSRHIGIQNNGMLYLRRYKKRSRIEYIGAARRYGNAIKTDSVINHRYNACVVYCEEVQKKCTTNASEGCHLIVEINVFFSLVHLS